MPISSFEETGDPRICIAVLDGPVDLSHRCLADARIELPLGRQHFEPGSAAAAHGTHVASIIFGARGSDVAGVAPSCSGLSIPIFAGDGPDGLSCSQLDLARAINIALEGGAHVISISGGQFNARGEADPLLLGALADCEERDVLVVAAAGNDGCDCPHLPADVPTVLAVGATDKYGTPLASSNWGAHYRHNGILAPGERIRGASIGGGSTERTGTSFAVPIVSGFAGRLLARQLAAGQRPSPLRIRELLIGAAIKCDPENPNRDRYLAGGLNVAGAIQELNGGKSVMNSEAIHIHEADHADAPQTQAAEAEAKRPAVRAAEAVPELARSATGISASCGCGESKDCGCGCGGAKKAAAGNERQLVYALGQIGYDFGSETRRDSVAQFMGGKSPTDPAALIRHLRDTKKGGFEDIERLTWTLNLDNTPIYAIQPIGAYAYAGYAKILEAFEAQNRRPADNPVTLFAVPGRIIGTARLMSGETVPILLPSTRGMLAWDVRASVERFITELKEQPQLDEGEEERREREEHTDAMERRLPRFLADFRNLITRKYRNLGLLGRDRALNFASTAAYRVFEILHDIARLELAIDDISVVKSPSCRAESECYDVQLKLFKPSDTTFSLQIYQFTLDVGDTIPVGIGEISSWQERPRS